MAAGEFNAQDVANIAWAFGRFGYKSEQLFEQVGATVCDMLGGERGAHARVEFSAQQLSMIAWAFGKVGIRDAKSMMAIVRESEGRIDSFTPRDLTDLIWALAQVQVKAPKFVKTVGESAIRKLSEFNSQELMRFMGAYRRAGGNKAIHAQLLGVDREIRYEFPDIPGKPTVSLVSETPGMRRQSGGGEVGDPQRADGRATGVTLWEASYVLADWLSRQKDGLTGVREICKIVPRRCLPKRWHGATGVELGAGLGLPSIVSAHLGVKMTATDGDADVLRLLRHNVSQNEPAAGPELLQAEELLWGTPNPLYKLNLETKPDLLLAADVVYASCKQELTKKLLDTMLELTGPKTLIVLSNILRFPEGHPEGESYFFEAAAEHFESAIIPQHFLQQDYQRSGVGGCNIRIMWRRSKTPEFLAAVKANCRRKKSKKHKTFADAAETLKKRKIKKTKVLVDDHMEVKIKPRKRKKNSLKVVEFDDRTKVQNTKKRLKRNKVKAVADEQLVTPPERKKRKIKRRRA